MPVPPIFVAAPSPAAIAARDAAREACRAFLEGYQHSPGDIPAARYYASCVFDIFGSGGGHPTSLLLAKIAVAAFLLLFSAGFVMEFWNSKDPIEAFIMGALCVLVSVIVVFFLGIFAAGIWFVLS